MSSFKLAFKNVGKSIRDYAVYFLTLALGVCIFYVFNSMDSQTLLIGLSAAQGGVLQMLSASLNYTSVFVSAILAFLILYANKYLMRRRKKELGVYLLLGMGKGKVSFVLAMETAIIGLLALATGLLVGILLSQGLSVLVASMFQVKLGVFRFVFSASAFFKTLLYFSVIFLVVMLLNMRHVARCKLVTLFNAERVNEKHAVKPWVSVLAFFASAACLGYAYQQIIDNGLVLLNAQFNRAILFGILGTLLFFFSLSGFLLRLIKSNKTLYYRGLNSFVFRQLNSKINTNFLSMAFVCLMLFFAIAVTATGSGLNYALTKAASANTPYDATLSIQATGEEEAKSILQENNLQPEKYFSDSCMFSYRETGISFSAYLAEGDFPSSGLDIGKRTFDAVSVSEYNHLMRMQGKAELNLGEAEYAVAAPAEKCHLAGQKLLDAGEISLGERRLRAGSAPLQTYFLETMSANPLNIILVLPDDVASELPVQYLQLAGNYPEGKKEEMDALLARDYSDWQGMYVTTASEVMMMEIGMKAMVLFILLYLGVIFLIAASAVLALQQLSETADNVSRYTLLRKLGVDDDMARKAMRRQVSLYFFVPLALALVHSAVAIYVVTKMIAEFKVVDSLFNILCAAGILLVLYGLYYVATYQSCKGMIRERVQK